MRKFLFVLLSAFAVPLLGAPAVQADASSAGPAKVQTEHSKPGLLARIRQGSRPHNCGVGGR